MVRRIKLWLNKYVHVCDPSWYEHGDVIRLRPGVPAQRGATRNA